MAMFKGFKPQGLQKIANSMGYTGSLEGFDSYLQQNPDKQNMMNMYNQRAMQMAQGGVVRKMQTGGIIGKFPMGNPIPGMFGAPVGSLGTPTQEQPQPKNANTLPDYDAFKQYQSTIPNNMFRASSAVIVPRRLADGTVINFGSPLQAEDYDNYLKSIGKPPTTSPSENANLGFLPADPRDTPAVQPQQPKTIQDMMVGEPVGQPMMTSPGFDPRYEGTDSSAYGQQNQLLSINDLYNQAVIPPTLGGDFSYYRPQAGETLYRNYTEARKANPNMQHSGIYTAVMPPAGTYAFKADGTRVTVPEGFFGPNSNPLPYRINPVDPRNTPAVQPRQEQQAQPRQEQQAQQQPITQVMTDPRQQAYVPTLGTAEGQVPAYGTTSDPKGIGDVTSTLAQTGAIPVGAVTQPELTNQQQGQFIDPATGQLTSTPVAPTYGADTSQAAAPTQVTSTQMQAAQATPAVQTAIQTNQAAQADVSDPRAQVLAAQQTASSVSNLEAAQGTATLMDNPVQRKIQSGELIDGVADAQTAASFTEQVQAATATPSEKATVQGQLASLTANFDMSNPPPWAAGALRGIQAQLQQRGLGASSIAGQALIQGALESALPIAQADAQVTAQFEAQNLSNRQQRAMLAAQQRATFIGQEFDQAFQARVQNASRIGDIANMNFTAEQQVALENSRVANTMNLNNLSNRQAMVVAEASALANMDLSNLSNAQQAAVQNAQNFLQLDMANLSNEQQTQLFNAQAINQSLLTDQAATNAARQFNATSQNQVDQFMASLANQVSQFNSTQMNAQNQFNAGELNTLSRFNAEVANQRDQFNATNQLAIAQNNAVWRREIATADTAAINRANELNAKAVLDVSNVQYDNLWNFYADTMEWAWRSAEGEQDRNTELAKANIDADARAAVAAENAGAKGASAIGNLVGTLGSAYIGSKAFTGFCWVAREVYGQYNPQWFMFRLWMKKRAPSWLYNLYGKYGESFASFISDKPLIKKGIKYFMNKVKL